MDNTGESKVFLERQYRLTGVSKQQPMKTFTLENVIDGLENQGYTEDANGIII